MVRWLTVRTVHIGIVNICVCGSTVVGEILSGPRLSVKSSRGVLGCVGVCVYITSIYYLFIPSAFTMRMLQLMILKMCESIAFLIFV